MADTESQLTTPSVDHTHVHGELNESDQEGHGVDVAKGEAEFSKLRTELGRHSKSHDQNEKDLEAAKDDDEFDLYDYLSSTQSESSKAGIKRKRMGVTWTNLDVKGAASMSLGVRTFPDALTSTVLSVPMLLAKMCHINLFGSGSSRKLLQNFNGSLQPGEMCLVIGRPGSGCSTFLKTIANQRGGFMGVDGEVTYGGLESDLFTKKYRGEVVYCEEDDVHFPTLTVEQTLEASLRFKSPGKKLPGENAKDFRNRVLDMMLKMLNIEHTRHTKVGSAYVRGVSGGERKRVSIAEALTTRACVLSWDNSSRGLDASTALDYAKSMRLLTNVLGLSSFISLYQAGEGIWEQFDKVLVIDAGRCVYFGPRTEARQYFISQGFADLPRQTSADYCTGCTDKYERRFQEGRNETNVASSPEQMEQAYLNSDICKREVTLRDEYKAEIAKDNEAAAEFQAAVKEDKHKGVRKSSNYTVSFPQQIYALWLRQLAMLMGDKFDIAVSYITALAIALIAGSLFYQLPVTAAGAFTRGGVLFIGLLFNSLTAFSELPTQMGGRPILYRQNGFCFYRPSALSLAQLAADVPLGAPRILMFTIVLYFMAGLTYTAGAFFTAFINILVSYYAFRSLFALFGTICRSYDIAARLAAGIIISLVLFAGYVIPRDGMARWLFWISYMNPVYYGFEALMVNEFKNLNLACVDTYITPRGDGYPTNIGANQVCTLAGSTAGQQNVPGLDYLNASFGFERKNLWLNFGIQVIFFVGLTAITCVAIEVLQMGSFASALTIKKKANKEEAKLDARLQARLDGTEEKVDGKIDVYGRAFTWSKLNYTVPVKGGERVLLNEISGYVKPGELTALMGASGAGKTTLLDVLADRKSIGKIQGDRLIEGKPVDVDFQRGCGYAEQQDIHEHTATVREALRFSAYLRQPAHVSKEDKDSYVEDIIELLEMQDLANAQIGFPAFGLGVADRKRVTIAVELAAKPDQLLFLDEPTSGLDGQGAYTIVRLLKKLAANGQTILCTIHQPNSLLFEQFDRLLLLERGGHTVYFGPVGKDSCHLVEYFKENGAECPEAVNPAEFMLEAVGAGSGKRIGPRDWKDVYLDSKLYQNNIAEIEAINAAGSSDKDRGAMKEYSTPFMYQLKTVLKRTLLSSWRQPDYQFTRLFQHAIIALLTGLLFLQLGNSVATLQYRIFGLFIVSVIPAIIIAQIEPFYIMARGIFIRENTSKMYHPVVFSLAQTISELPYAVLCSIVYFLIFYYTAGYQSSSDRAGYFFAMFLVTEIFAITLGQAVAALNPSIYLASVWNPFLILIFSLFCGVTIPKPNMTYFWREWMYWLDPFTYVISGLTVNELHSLPIQCTQSELAIFTAPTGQTCQQYADPFVQANGGYLVNQSNGDCGYCQYSDGDEFYASLQIKFSERGRDIGVMIAFCVFNVVVTNVASRYMKFANR